ncbi:MAG: stage 0 sporulation family protein [Clostridia bacterium]|nr:stage 0 sporulation family protein [Clostridia bacterium]
MAEVIGVRFKANGKTYYFNPKKLDIKKGDNVIVETSRGLEYGNVVQGRKNVPEKELVKSLKDVVRVATPDDDKTYKRNKEKEKEAYNICLEKIKENNLVMKLVEVEYTFDQSKILFYFTADGRVDFRKLVKDLALIFKTRIELRQIGVRDESKAMGSIGICGRSLCCSQFLDEFAPVSIKMAKEQNLSLNPAKISGACGRLMCCLKYEQEMYEELNRKTPKNGAKVKTPNGDMGIVESVSLLKGLVKVKIDDGNEGKLEEYSVGELKVLTKGKDKGKELTDKEIAELDKNLG